MPLDPTVAFIFATLFLALVASLLYAYWYQTLKHKAKHGSPQSSQSLKVSELEDIVRKAVEDATATLDERLAGIQRNVNALTASLDEARGSPRLEHKKRPLLEVPNDDAEEDSPASSRRRVR